MVRVLIFDMHDVRLLRLGAM